jgi:hypothetical protein
MLQGKGKEKDKAVGEEREEGRLKEKHEDSEEERKRGGKAIGMGKGKD